MNGQILSPARRSPEALAQVERALEQAERANDHAQWRRARAVLGYARGESAAALAVSLAVDRKSITRWVRAYERTGVEALVPDSAPGASCRLSQSQREQLAYWLEKGPEAVGFASGVWTGARVAHFIERYFHVSYAPKYVPQLLQALGFSVQRPRKLLAAADPAKQATWVNERLPALKKKGGRRGRRALVRRRGELLA